MHLAWMQISFLDGTPSKPLSALSFGRPARGVSKQKFLVSFRHKLTIFGDFAKQQMRNNPHTCWNYFGKKRKAKVSFLLEKLISESTYFRN